MVLLRLHAMMAAGAAAAALTAGGAAAGLAMAGPVDSSGVIHGCYAAEGTKGSYQLTLQKAGTQCPGGTTAITWNQKGHQGAAGATGPAGPPGPAGPAGPGLDFTTASGTNGPAISTAGTYFVDVTVGPQNQTDALSDLECFVGIPETPGAPPTPLFSESYQLPAGGSGTFTLSGIAAIPAGVTPSVTCIYPDSGQFLTIEFANWYVSPVQTTG